MPTTLAAARGSRWQRRVRAPTPEREGGRWWGRESACVACRSLYGRSRTPPGAQQPEAKAQAACSAGLVGPHCPGDAKGTHAAGKAHAGASRRQAHTPARCALLGPPLPGNSPVSTTMVAFVFHAGALWALPQVPAPSAASLRPAAGYQLHRFDPATRRWALVSTKVWDGGRCSGRVVPTTCPPLLARPRCCLVVLAGILACGSGRPHHLIRAPSQGVPPQARSEAAAAFMPDAGLLVIQGGTTLAHPRRLLSDVHALNLAASPPAWNELRPVVREAAPSEGGGSGGGLGGGGMLAVTAHAGAAAGGWAVFVGGCRRMDRREPEAVVQVGPLGGTLPPPWKRPRRRSGWAEVREGGCSRWPQPTAPRHAREPQAETGRARPRGRRRAAGRAPRVR
jgi:hypothetical protein